MNAMISKNVQIDPELAQLLRNYARQQGIKEVHVIRRALRKFLMDDGAKLEVSPDPEKPSDE